MNGDQEQSPLGSAHPVLIVGIAVFVLPYFNSVLHMNIPKWVSVLGIVLILMGAGLTIWKLSS